MIPAPLNWQKSSFSGSGQDNACIEVAASPTGLIHLRESDDPGAILATTPAKLQTFILGAKKGEFDSRDDV
jgi:hypothetical protein